MDKSATRLTIVILTCSQRTLTRHCLLSLGALVGDPRVRVIVVDNASSDDTAAMLNRDFPTVEVIVNDTNRGVAPARNQGITAATGDYVLLLDNDTLASPQAVNALMEYADSHPRVGLCACRLTGADGAVQDSLKPYPGLLAKVRNVLGLKPAATQFHIDDDGAIEPTYVIGACQLIRREAINEVGLLDEAIFYGPEDADYCLRLASAGWLIRYLPWVTITHLWQRATTRRLLSPLGRKHIAGLWHFWRKHHRWLK